MNNHPHITTFYRLLWVFHWHWIHFTIHFMLAKKSNHLYIASERFSSSFYQLRFNPKQFRFNPKQWLDWKKKIQLNLVRLIWIQTTYVQECGISGRNERDHNITETDKTVGVIQWVDITPNITFSNSKCIGHTF